MGYVLGVDFGTSFTAAVAYASGASRVVTLGKRAGAVPTATFVREDGTLIHGEDAYLVGAHDPDRLVRNLKRRLADPAAVRVGGRSYPPATLISAYLRWVVDAASRSEGAPPDRLLFTHPANWRSLRLDQFRQALAEGGLTEVSFASEPFAAAAFHAVSGQVNLGDLIGVYDLGGGTFDAAVLRRVEAGFELAGEPEGVEHLGGVDFDDVLFHLVRTRAGEAWTAAERKGGPSLAVAVASVRRECIEAKEALSIDTEVQVPVMLPGVNLVVKVTRNDFERLIAPSVQDTIGAFRRSLRQAGVSPSQLSAVLLVGGSVALGVVRLAVREVVGDLTPVLDADPKYAVARGAALLAAQAESALARSVAPAAASAAAPVGPVSGWDAPVGPATVAANAVSSPPRPPRPASFDPTPPPSARPLAPVPGAMAAPSGSALSSVAPPVAARAVQGRGPTDGGQGLAGGPAGVPTRTEPLRANDGSGRGARASFTPTPPRRSLVKLSIGAVAALAVVAGVTVFALSRGGSEETAGGSAQDPAGVTSESGDTTAAGAGDRDPASSTSSSGTATKAAGGGQPAPGKASADAMSSVSAGTYTVGLNPPGAESARSRPVELKAFFLDTFEVTNKEYDAFVQQRGAPPATAWPGRRVPDAQLDHPVHGVEWVWARAYCNALSKRLPTEAEWEAAARGPDTRLYPWGENRAQVDIDTAGSRPAGSTAGNVSVFGIQDSVASVWEWVDKPYDAAPSGQQVRHGGENGRVRDGAAMRQVVDPANKSVIAETGFRCAADQVDPAVKAGKLNPDTVLPDPVEATMVTQVQGSGPGTVLVEDNFETRTSGFREGSGADHAVGYYAPSWYHLEATGTRVQTVSTGGYSYENASVETHVHVDGTTTGHGRVRYGLVVRATGDQRPPLASGGPPRVSNFMAFTIDPRAGRWELLQEDAQPLRLVQSGSLPAGVRAFDKARPDALRVDMKGTVLTLFINGTQVASVDTGVTERNGDVGFFVENLDETFSDVHFADLKIVAL